MVQLTQRAKKCRVERMKTWEGTVVGFFKGRVYVLWPKAGSHKIWLEDSQDLENVERWAE